MKLSRRQIIAGVGALGSLGVLASFKMFDVFSKSAAAGDVHPDLNQIMKFHEQNFGPFVSKLSSAEKNYIQNVAPLAEANGFQVKDDFFYSSFTFSYRVQGDRVKAQRFALGSFSYPDKVSAWIKELASEKKIDLNALPQEAQLLGVGWDLDEEHVKIYAHIKNHNEIKGDRWQELLKPREQYEVEPFALVSATYKEAQVIERKIYLPLTKKSLKQEAQKYPFSSEIININLMVTDRRGIVPQADLVSGNSVSLHLNESGQKIVGEFNKMNLSIDTIAYQGPDEHTLYFG